VVPRAEKKIDGGGEMVVRCAGQVDESAEVCGWSFASWDLGSRRETVYFMLG